MSPGFKQQLPYIGAIIALIPSIWIEYHQGNFIIALIFFCLTILNMIALRLYGASSATLNIILNILNAVAVFLIAVQFLKTGKSFLHFPYFIACGGFLTATVISYFRFRKTKIYTASR
jgi:hypothetical protein